MGLLCIFQGLPFTDWLVCRISALTERLPIVCLTVSKILKTYKVRLVLQSVQDLFC